MIRLFVPSLDSVFTKMINDKDSIFRFYPYTVSAIYSVAPYVGSNTTYAAPFVEVTIDHTVKVSSAREKQNKR